MEFSTKKTGHKNLFAYRDSKTGLFNADLLDDIIDGIVKLNRYEQYSVILFEIERHATDPKDSDFIGYNMDKIASVLVGTVRPSDIVLKYNQQEFLILTDNTNDDTAEIIINRIRSRIPIEFDEIKQDLNISTGCSSSNNLNELKEVIINASIDKYNVEKYSICEDSSDILDIKNKIEKLRCILNRLLSEKDNRLIDKVRVLDTSRRLDQLINIYIKKLSEIDKNSSDTNSD